MSLDKNVSRNKLTIMKIVSIYALFGGLWIYTSDSLLVSITHNPLLISKLSVLKGFVFISLTALLLYSLIARMVSQLKTTEDSLHTTKNLYRLISENSADVIWLMDIETQYFTYVSPSVERLRGYTVEEVMRQPVELALTPESYHRIAELLPLRLKAFLAGDERARINITEIEQPCKDGSIVPTEVVTTLLTNADHTVTTILGVSRNISERKQFEKSLHQSMEQYRMLFKNNPMPLWVYDRKTLAFLDVNDAAVHRYGYSAEEFRSMTLKDIRPAEEIPKLLKSVSHDKQLMRETGIWKHRKKDGTLIDVEITVHDIDYYGVPARLVLAEDVTAWKQAEEALQESAEKMRLLIEGNRDFFFYTQDTNATITYISPSIEKITGYSVDQWIGQKHWFASDSPINDFAREQTQLHLQGKFDRHAVYLEIIHANGDKILLEGFENPIIRDNKVVGLHGIARDITEQKKSELLLKQSEEKFKAAFITSPDSININRMSDGRYISINKGFTRIMGYTEEEIIGKSSLELNIWVHAEEREKFVAVLQKNGKVENFESQFRAKDGTLRTGLMSASILQLDNEPHIISITRDITEINRLQEELTQSQKMLSIGTLAGGIAHDFNNILNIILGYTAMLEKRKSDGQKFSESISAITQAVDRGSALVRQILTFARKTEVEFKPLYMPDIIRELFSMLKQTFPKIFTFHEEMETSLPFILGDQTQLHQVFLNLCVNARDAMPHGGSITIHIRTVQGIQIQERFSGADQNRYMCISVEDTGLGMDDATRQRIFDPFFTTKGAGKGTGLGLAVVYGIIQAHHGFIDVHSMLGSGTRFDIYLPIAGHEQQLPRSSPEKSAEELRGSEMILIVEDEDFLLEVLRNILESHGYSVISARNGKEAIALYQQHQQDIDLVLTDMGLPLMTGRDEYLMLKKINPHVRVIIASGFFEPDVKTELAEEGVREFIQKPYRPEELLRMIRLVLDSAMHISNNHDSE